MDSCTDQGANIDSVQDMEMNTDNLTESESDAESGVSSGENWCNRREELSDSETLEDATDCSEDEGNAENVDSNCETGPSQKKKAKKDIALKAMDYWSVEDGAMLHSIINKYGTLDSEFIAEIMQTKTPKQIEDFFSTAARIAYHDRFQKAQQRTVLKVGKLRKAPPRRKLAQKSCIIGASVQERKSKYWKRQLAAEKGDGPIDWWLSFMEKITRNVMKPNKKSSSKTSKLKAISELLPKMCLIISKWENHPDPSLCHGVDYGEAYNYLYHLLSGVPGKELSTPTALLLVQSIEKLRGLMLDRKYSPEYNRFFGAQVDHIMTSTECETKFDDRTYSKQDRTNSGRRKSEDGLEELVDSSDDISGIADPLQSLRRLMNIPSYNPLNMPEKLVMKPGHTTDELVDQSVLKRKPRGSSTIPKVVPHGLFSEMG